MGSAAGAVIDSWTGLRGLRMVLAALTLQGDGHGDHRHGEGSGQDPNDDVAGIAGLGGAGLAGLTGSAGIHGTGIRRLLHAIFQQKNRVNRQKPPGCPSRFLRFFRV